MGCRWGRAANAVLFQWYDQVWVTRGALIGIVEIDSDRHLVLVLLVVAAQIHHQLLLYSLALVRRVLYFERGVILILLKVIHGLVLSAQPVQVDGRVLLISDIQIGVFEVLIGLKLRCRLVRDVVELITSSTLAKIVEKVVVVVGAGISKVQLVITVKLIISHMQDLVQNYLWMGLFSVAALEFFFGKF